MCPCAPRCASILRILRTHCNTQTRNTEKRNVSAHAPHPRTIQLAVLHSDTCHGQSDIFPAVRQSRTTKLFSTASGVRRTDIRISLCATSIGFVLYTIPTRFLHEGCFLSAECFSLRKPPKRDPTPHHFILGLPSQCMPPGADLQALPHFGRSPSEVGRFSVRPHQIGPRLLR